MVPRQPAAGYRIVPYNWPNFWPVKGMSAGLLKQTLYLAKSAPISGQNVPITGRIFWPVIGVFQTGPLTGQK